MPERRAYEPGRMRRAAVLACEKLGPGQYRVSGQQEPYYDVDLSVDPACYCADQLHRRAMCKHEIRARLQDGDARLLQALGDMLLAAEKRLKESMKSKKRGRRSAAPIQTEGR